MRIDVRGERFTAYLDGQPVFSASDSANPMGRVGLRAWESISTAWKVRPTIRPNYNGSPTARRWSCASVWTRGGGGSARRSPRNLCLRQTYLETPRRSKCGIRTSPREQAFILTVSGPNHPRTSHGVLNPDGGRFFVHVTNVNLERPAKENRVVVWNVPARRQGAVLRLPPETRHPGGRICITSTPPAATRKRPTRMGRGMRTSRYPRMGRCWPWATAKA